MSGPFPDSTGIFKGVRYRALGNHSGRQAASRIWLTQASVRCTVLRHGLRVGQPTQRSNGGVSPGGVSISSQGYRRDQDADLDITVPATPSMTQSNQKGNVDRHASARAQSRISVQRSIKSGCATLSSATVMREHVTACLLDEHRPRPRRLGSLGCSVSASGLLDCLSPIVDCSTHSCRPPLVPVEHHPDVPDTASPSYSSAGVT